MKEYNKFFDYCSFCSGLCGVFLILSGLLKLLAFFPALVGGILFFIGILAIIIDKYYWNKVCNINPESDEEFGPYVTSFAQKELLKKTSSQANRASFFEVINTLLQNLPLKKFSPGQTLIFLVSVLLLLFILGVMLIQASYDLDVFRQSDLRIGALIVGIILLLYTVLYTLGELLGIKLFNSKKRLSK